MKSIRRGVFETNSSSTHSLSIISGEEFEKWQNGETYFDKWNGKILTQEEYDAKIKEYKENDYDIEDALSDEGIVTYEQWEDEEDLENYMEKYITVSGDEIVVFGQYGRD